MKVIATLDADFDASEFVLYPCSKAPYNSPVTIRGKAAVKEQLTRQGKPYASVTVFDVSGNKLAFPIWSNHHAFSLASKADGAYVEIQCVLSRKSTSFISVDVKNMSIIDEIDPPLGGTEAINLEDVFDACLARISDPFYRDLVDNAVSIVGENLFTAPATEKTAFNFRGGLITQICNGIVIVNRIAQSFTEAKIGEGSLILDESLLMACVVLSNIGRVDMLEINDNNEIVKTRKGYLENDLSIAREITKRALEMTYSMKWKTEDGEVGPKYEFNPELVEEIVHIISSSRERPDYGALTLPRTKHAVVLAQALALTHAKGQFETLNRTVREGESFARLYDGARVYLAD